MLTRVRAPIALVIAAWCVFLGPADGTQRIAAVQAEATAVLAGGCFWGVEAVFEHVRGVRSVTSGYARYTHASSPPRIEAVRIVYDPSRVSYRQLLEVFFLVAHDPTSMDRQGPDAGSEYRAAVLHETSAERDAAEAFVAELTRTGEFARPIVTEIRELDTFRTAEPGHQDYAARHPADPYVLQNDAPKLSRLQRRFPSLYQAERAR
ncbi:MAG TPA: peptide-methionine (S)-S-oxide reductase MsrA [Vicinamibacterales bacterium]|nr:peptide-methionine (S)-S-oxide reductase MsrA [Vicinamibacterales bacterium]